MSPSSVRAPLTPFPVPPSPAPVIKNETLGEILSPSQANTFLNCSAKWWFRYGIGLPDPKSGSLVRGLAVHKTIERWFKLSLEGATPKIEDTREPYDDAWDSLSVEALFAADDDIDELKRLGAVLLRKYLEEVAPEIRPATIEQQVMGDIGGVKETVFTRSLFVSIFTTPQTEYHLASRYLQVASFPTIQSSV
jgi:PD-(D/E)XK nuclease superfamily protein